MRFCEICREPALRSSVVLNHEKQRMMRYYCYLHAIEAGLLGGRWALLPAVAATAGYSTNAVALVLEALSQRGCMTEVDGAHPGWSITTPTKTPEELCTAFRRWAVQQFDGHSEHLVLKHWKLILSRDIGWILSCSAQSGVVALQDEHAAPVLKALCALKRELLTFPYDDL